MRVKLFRPPDPDAFYQVSLKLLQTMESLSRLECNIIVFRHSIYIWQANNLHMFQLHPFPHRHARLPLAVAFAEEFIFVLKSNPSIKQLANKSQHSHRTWL